MPVPISQLIYQQSLISHSGELHYTTSQPVMFACAEYTLMDRSLYPVCPPVTHQSVLFLSFLYKELFFDKPVIIILAFFYYIKIRLHYIIMISHINITILAEKKLFLYMFMWLKR